MIYALLFIAATAYACSADPTGLEHTNRPAYRLAGVARSSTGKAHTYRHGQVEVVLQECMRHTLGRWGVYNRQHDARRQRNWDLLMQGHSWPGHRRNSQVGKRLGPCVPLVADKFVADDLSLCAHGVHHPSDMCGTSSTIHNSKRFLLDDAVMVLSWIKNRALIRQRSTHLHVALEVCA